MKTSFEERLNQILPRLASPDVLDNRGAGGEIGFWVFDYPPEHEMEMRAWITNVIEPGLPKLKPGIQFKVIDLFEFVVALLEERKLLDKTFAKQLKEGDESVLKSLRPVLKEDKLAARLVAVAGVQDLDLLLIKGVGAVYPMLRTHTLLSALHPHMREKPLVMFYPGRYDGQSLRLFSKLTDDNYYRAFSLVS